MATNHMTLSDYDRNIALLESQLATLQRETVKLYPKLNYNQAHERMSKAKELQREIRKAKQARAAFVR